MTKEIRLAAMNISGTIANVNTWYKATTVLLLENTGKTAIRLDKEMAQLTGYHNAAMPCYVGAVVHLSDETGASFDASVSAGVTDLAAMETLLRQWRDNVFMTDFQVLGTGYDETNVFVSNLEADTRRVLLPGQKLLVSVFVMPLVAETAKSAFFMLDNILWYSASASA